MRVAQKEQKFLVFPRENWNVSIPEMKRTHTHTLGWKRLKKSSSNSFWVHAAPWFEQKRLKTAEKSSLTRVHAAPKSWSKYTTDVVFSIFYFTEKVFGKY